MAQNQCIQGLHALDELGWVHENGAGYLRNAAESYLEKRKEGSVLAVTPTWKENYELTGLIRAGLKEEGALKGEPKSLETLTPLKWTVAEKRCVTNYEVGPWIVATGGSAGSISHGKVKQVTGIERGHVVFGDGSKLNVRENAHKIEVANYRMIEIQEGDKVQLMANDKKKGLVNGDVYTVKSLNQDGSMDTEEGKHLPADFRAIAHGYVLTSHKSQGKTADYVVVAAEKLRSKACYVASSRGRESATIHTIEKDRLFDGLPKSEDRLSAIDILKASRTESRYMSLENYWREIESRSMGQSMEVMISDSIEIENELERLKQQVQGKWL
jgi:hypothetical protein